MTMNRRAFLRTTIGGTCLAAAHAAWGQEEVPAAKPNIVLVMADDQGWGDMAYNGHPVVKTPHFDAMAAAPGIRFDRFYAAAPVCSPTRGSVMTGRTPNRFGCFKWGYTLRPQEITLPEALKTAGYVTGHFGKWHLGPVLEGSPVNPGASGFDEWLSAPNFFDNDPILSREGKAVQCKGESSMVTADAAIQFIRKHAESPQPFLAVVWFGSPHKPHEAIEEDRAPYADQQKAFQHFYGEITGMDRAFGKLRQELRTLGIHENTILWYCSDNGGLPKVGSPGGRAHKGSIYEGGLRVPAILEWPARLKEHEITNLPCVTSDIYPTLLDLVGVKMAEQPELDGISLAPLLEGKMRKRKKGIGFWDYPIKGLRTPSAELMADLLRLQEEGKAVTDPELLRTDAGDTTTQYPEDYFPGHSAWLEWPLKLHRKQDQNRVIWELYNLEDDPMEATDLYKEGRRTRKMQSRMEDWLASVVRSLNGQDK